MSRSDSAVNSVADGEVAATAAAARPVVVSRRNLLALSGTSKSRLNCPDDSAVMNLMVAA